MKTQGRLTGIQVPFRSEKAVISFEVTADPADVERYKDKELDITIVRHSKKRGLAANAMLWACLGEIAAAARTDNWSAYLYMLERYGKYSTVLIKAEALPDLRRVWRETRVVGEREDGMVEVLCFYGSSTYTTEEFSRLLDGVVSDMKELGLTPPPSREMQAALEELERQEHAQRKREGDRRERAGVCNRGQT
nr:MAG TPA: NinB protein [Caudoviricetes sp.]